MSNRSLFQKYFSICMFCVMSSILILGVVLIVFASRYFEQDKYTMMQQNVQYAAELTAQNYANNGYTIVNRTVISATYSVLSRAIGAEFFLTDASGRVLFYDNSQTGLDYSSQLIPEAIVQQAMSDTYEQTGLMQGLYSEPRYVVGVPVDGLNQPIGALFASCPADDLYTFLNELIQMFLFSTLVVLVVAFFLIWVITRSMVRPLQQMLDAVQSFTKGDFTKRVQVASGDEIGQLSMAFNNMATTLSSTESSRRSFVANVSHELKTPMTTIGGFVDGVLDGTIPEERRDHYLQIVSNEIRRLSRLVRSMLDTSRIEAGELQVHPVQFDIAEIVRQTIISFEQLIDEKELDIRGLDTDKVIVEADIDLIHQVVYNLVENAVKFVDVGGYIAFDFRVVDGMAHVAIRNSGPGIDKNELPYLFDRFYKSDRSRSLNKSGTGLGLHIVRTILQYHQGEIAVRSEPGEYTEFEFAISSAEPREPKKSRAGKPEPKISK